MLAFRNNYFYVDGKITNFSMMSAQGMNFGQLYLIATGDITQISMMSMNMANAGVVAMTKGKYASAAAITMSGMSTASLLAHGDITLNSGMNLSMGNRMHILTQADIGTASMMTFGGLTGTGSHCGCTGSADESTEMQIGRRFSKS
jgi:hypothetical protein